MFRKQLHSVPERKLYSQTVNIYQNVTKWTASEMDFIIIEKLVFKL